MSVPTSQMQPEPGRGLELHRGAGAVQLARTAADVRSHVNLIQEVMGAVMKQDVHYGKIPGTPKPTLYKPGCEVLAATFRIAPSYKITDLCTDDVVRYRVICVGTHQVTGQVLGEGVGECSSNEAKYKWRKTRSKSEFEATPENRRRIEYKSGQNGDYEILQVRAETADCANTILKMACKRAQVAMTLNVTSASDIFAQDIEDLPEHLREADEASTGGRQRPGQQAAQAAQPQNTPERQALIGELDAEAKKGSEALKTKWGEIGEAKRKQVGTEELNRLKKIADGVDYAGADVP